jgi:hypothetical protein
METVKRYGSPKEDVKLFLTFVLKLIIALYHKRKEVEVNVVGPEQIVKKLSIKKAHKILSHMNKDMC